MSMKIPEKFSMQQIKQIYADLQVRKTALNGRQVAIIGKAIGFFEKLVNKIKKESEIHSTYGRSSKELKKLVSNQVKSDFEHLAFLLDQLPGNWKEELSNGQCIFAIELLDIISEIKNKLDEYITSGMKADEKITQLYG